MADDSPGRKRPKRRWLRFFARIVAIVVLLVLLAVGALLYRLSSGPLSLDFLTGYVIAALEPADGSFRVSIGATELVWTERWYDVDLSVRDVRCTDASGATLASLSSLSMELSVEALLHGEVAPREIELAGPQLGLVREADGDIDFGLGRDATTAGGESVFAKLFAAAQADQGASPASRFLRSIVIRQGQLTLLDVVSGFKSQAEDVEVDLQRDGEAIDVNLGTAVELGDERIPLQATIRRGGKIAGTEAKLTFRDLEPSEAMEAATVLNPPPGSVAASILEAAGYLRLPLAGTIDLTLDEQNAVRTVGIDASADKGEIVLPAPLDQKLAIERIDLAADYDAATDTAKLQHFEVDLGVPDLTVSGSWSGMNDGALVLDATIANLPTDSIASYWPATAAVSARTWVTRNITRGSVRSASVTLHGALVPGQTPSFAVRDLKGKLGFEGLSVRYVDTMAEAAGVRGSATFSQDGFDFKVDGAKVAGVAVPGATVVISGFTAKVTRIAIDAQARGTLRDALTLVNAEPLHYARTIGVDPAAASGNVRGRVKFLFPLAGAPIPDDLGVVVTAQLDDAALPKVVGDWSMSGGKLDLEVTSAALSITGNAQIQGVSCDISWREDLTVKSGVSRHVDVKSRVDADGRAALGYDFRPYLTGPTAVTARIEQRHDGKGTAAIAVDLADATLDAPSLRLVKHPGAPGRAEFTLALTGSKVTGIDPFTFVAPDTSAQGKAVLSSSGTTRFSSLTLDGTLPPYGPGDPHPQFTLTLQPAPSGNRFELTSNDASTLMRLIMPDGRTQGGRLTFGGTVQLEQPGLPFSGNLAIRSFRLTRSPVMARLLMLSSLSGIASTFQGEGLSFDALTTNIGYVAGAVTFTDGLVEGPSVHLVFNGTIDTKHDNVVMDGTLVPSFYGLNTAAGHVPLIGGLFGGSDGVIAVDFTIRGPMADPKIAVKPLSSIAPGILRRFARSMSW